MTDPNHSDLARKTLAILALAGLILTCFWIVRPFLPATIWAAMIVIATWPLLVGVEKKVGGRRPAVMVMMGLLILVFVIPFTLAVGTIVENATQIASLGKLLTSLQVPAPPDWVAGIPLIGDSVAGFWNETAQTDPAELAKRVSPYAKNVAGWLVAQAGDLGMMVVHFLLTLVLTALLYMHGEEAAALARRAAHRVASERGENAALLAARAVRAVAQGVVITALAQSLLAGLGLAVVGVPYASLLTALTFMLTIAQIGAGPVLIPAIIWLFWKGSTGWGIALLAWAVFVMSMDGFMRPILIRRNANLPLLLIFAGVIGGLIAFGVIGLFIGPVLLTVGYTLMKAWVDEGAPAEEPEPAAGEE